MPGTAEVTDDPPAVESHCCRKIVIADVPVENAGNIGGVYVNTGKQYNGKDYYLRTDRHVNLLFDIELNGWTISHRNICGASPCMYNPRFLAYIHSDHTEHSCLPNVPNLLQSGSVFHCEAKWWHARCKEGEMTWQKIEEDVLQCADEIG